METYATKGGNEIVLQTSSQAGRPLPTVTKEVSDFLERAKTIASSLNHPQLTSAHLILAMTLSDYSSDQFREKFPEEGVYLACWHRLAELRPAKDSSGTSGIDNDVHEILAQAAVKANRRDPQHRAIGVGDIIEVLLATPPGSRLDEMLQGRASITAADVLYAVRQLRDELHTLVAQSVTQSDAQALQAQAMGSALAQLDKRTRHLFALIALTLSGLIVLIMRAFLHG